MAAEELNAERELRVKKFKKAADRADRWKGLTLNKPENRLNEPANKLKKTPNELMKKLKKKDYTLRKMFACA